MLTAKDESHANAYRVWTGPGRKLFNPQMVDESIRGTVWSDVEVDLIVADYFDMMQKQTIGEPFIKKEHNRRLQKVTGRTEGSIEYKHQNISAVLQRLGMAWLRGYAPMSNFQASLVEAVGRHLGKHRKLFLDTPLPEQTAFTFSDPTPLYIGSPPDLAPMPAAETAKRSLERLVRKFDPAARDERNRKLGKLGEERVYHSEKLTLAAQGRDDLARKVRWISEEDGDGAGYDILSFDPQGHERLIEVKTTTGHQTTPFYISENERSFAEERPDAFRLLRLYDFNQEPKAFELAPPLESSLCLNPIAYRASFGNPAQQS